MFQIIRGTPCVHDRSPLLSVKLPGGIPRFHNRNGRVFGKCENPVFHFPFSGIYFMFRVADEVARLPSPLVQLIDGSILPFLLLCKKGFGV
jgi:hypothetical protein